MPRIDWNDADKYAGSRSSFLLLRMTGIKPLLGFITKTCGIWT